MGFVIGFTQAAEGTSPERMFAFQENATSIVSKDPSIQAFVLWQDFRKHAMGFYL